MPAHPRQLHIEDDHIECDLLHGRQRSGSIRSGDDSMTHRFQCDPCAFYGSLLIVDNEDIRHGLNRVEQIV